MSEYTDSAKERMESCMNSLDHTFNKLRTGRASASLLEDITVDYYGAPTPITQVAAVKAPEARLLTVEPWDKGILNAVEKAILASDIGVTPNNDGSGVLRLPFPAPTEESRKDLVKTCKAEAENSRVAVRNVRKDVKNKMERAKKDGDLTEDELKREETSLQKLTDSYIAKVDEKLKAKEAEVMEI